MKSSRPQHLTSRRIQLLIFLGLLAQADAAFCSGIITNCTQADLQAALVGGGAVTFACSGTITLTNTLNIAQNTTIDASGYQVKISGGNAVRLFTVTNASFGVTGLTLADGRFVGANGVSPSVPGQEGGGACILNQGGTITLQTCTLTNHLAQGGDASLLSGVNVGIAGNGLGGAVCSFGGHIILTNCLVTGCAAVGGFGASKYDVGNTPGSSGVGLGGAIYLAGSSLSLQRVTLVKNRAAGGGGWLGLGESADGADGCGGAIYAANSPVNASDSILAGNTATSGPFLGGEIGTTSGDGSGGALHVAAGSLAVLTRCTFSTNSAISAYPGHHGVGGSGRGGAVFNGGAVQAYDSSWFSNSAVGAYSIIAGHLGQGGAVYSSNTAVVVGCTFYNNLAQGGDAPMTLFQGLPSGPGEGGGVWSARAFFATNCTWATNVAKAGSGYYTDPTQTGASGGAVCITGGSATLMNVTLAGNRADGDDTLSPLFPVGPSRGGGVMNTNGAVLILNSVLANSPWRTNSRAVLTGGSNVWGVVTDGGYNLSSDTTGGFTATGSLMNTDPMLAPLANYGGPTLTLWLLPGSPARDRIPSGFPPTDQRGAPRPQGPAADMGAVEADNPPAAPYTLVAGCSGANLTLSCTADDWRAYRLLRSTDLVTWTAIATNSSAGCGAVQFPQSTAGSKAFYRVVTP